MARVRILVGLAAVALLGGLGYAGYQRFLAPVPPAATGSAPLEAASPSSPDVVTAEGKVVPAREAALAFRMAGRAEVLVQEAQVVEAGAVLIRLDDADLQAAVTQAQAAVRQAEAAVAVAEAQRALAAAGPRPEAVAAAEAQLQAAEDAVRQADAQRDQAARGPTPDMLAAAEAQLAQARATQNELQIAYDRIIENNLLGTTEEQARFQLEAANRAVTAAQAAVDELKKGVSKDVLRAYNSAVNVAESQRAAAEAQLALLKAGASAEQLAVAEAQVAQARAVLEVARAGLETARTQLDQAVLTAPFTGTVVSLNMETGEMVTPGVPVLVLADLDQWRVKTTDLAEADVVLVSPGQSVSVTLDAFAGRAFRGTVTEIAALAETTRGNTTYAVTVALDDADAPLRWGMTAFVDIRVKP